MLARTHAHAHARIRACAAYIRTSGQRYNHSNPSMRKAWVASLQSAMRTGSVDGFFIDITPQALPNVTDPTDPIDGMVPYAQNVNQICEHCSKERQAASAPPHQLLCLYRYHQRERAYGWGAPSPLYGGGGEAPSSASSLEVALCYDICADVRNSDGS